MKNLASLTELPDADLARLARVLLPLVVTRSWEKAEKLVALWDEIVNADQEWYWTPEWQAAEAEADAQLASGQFDDFDTIDDLIADLQAVVSDE